MRKLEEARTAEREAAELRETPPRAPRGRPARTDPRGSACGPRSPAAATALAEPRYLVARLRGRRPGRRRRRLRGRCTASAATEAAAASGGKQSKACSRAKSRSRCSTAPRSKGWPAATATWSSARASSSARSPTATRASATASSCSSRGNAPRGAAGRQDAGDRAGAADDRGNRLRSRRRAGRGGHRRGQCLVGGLALGARRLRPARPRHARRLRLVPAAEARPTGPRPGHASARRPHRGPPRLHAERRLPLRPHPDPLPRHPLRHAHVQVVKPGGKLVVTLARDRFLKRYHFFTFYWDGRGRNGGTAPPGRYKLRVKLLGQDRVLVPPGVMRLHRAPREPAEGLPRPAGGGVERLPRRRRGAGRGRGRSRGDPAAAGPGPLGGDARRARPLPGADPRRPVALARRSSTCATTAPASPPSPSPRSAISRRSRSPSAAGRSCCPWRSSPPSPSASPCTPAATPRTCSSRSTS